MLESGDKTFSAVFRAVMVFGSNAAAFGVGVITRRERMKGFENEEVASVAWKMPTRTKVSANIATSFFTAILDVPTIFETLFPRKLKYRALR